MKRSLYLLLSIVAVFTFGIPSISFAGKPKPSATEAATKVSKQDAEMTVRFANTGCTIEGAELVKGKDHPNWAVNVVKRGEVNVTQVQVDGVTGKILPPVK